MKRFLFVLALVVFIGVPMISSAADVGYDGGFFIKNDDDSFKLTINGRFQPRFDVNKQTTAATTASFSLRRAQIDFKANIHKKVTARMSVKHATNSQSFANANASGVTVTYDVMPEFSVTTGMVGLPLSFMADTSSKWMLLNDAPVTDVQDDGVEDWTIPRNSFSTPGGLGVNFAGNIWKMFYSASVVNGAENNYAFNTSKKFSYGARVGIDILGSANTGSMSDYACSDSPQLTASVGSNYQTGRGFTAGGSDGWIKYIWTSSIGAAFRWGGFSLTTEGYYRLMKVPDRGGAIGWKEKLDDMGYYGAVGYFIVPKTFEIALQAGQIFREGPDNNANQFGGGVNYYALGNNFKLQLSYIWTEDYDDLWGAAANNQIHNISLMASTFF